jgi:hypothetical protein
MRLLLLSLLPTLALIPGANLAPSEQPETSRLAFVREYISGLAALESIREAGEREFKQASGGAVFTSAIHTSTLMQLELRTRIGALSDMHLNAPFDSVIPSITRFYEQKVALHQRLIVIASAFVGGPKDGVDFGRLAAETPQVRAGLDYVDDSLFRVTPVVFEVLVDQKPDSKNHVSHLTIAKAERAELMETLTLLVGTKLDQKGQNYGARSASFLRDALRNFKCADEPWE